MKDIAEKADVSYTTVSMTFGRKGVTLIKLLMLGCFLLFATVIFSGNTAYIEIPATGIFNLEEITVEAWVKFKFDPKEYEKGIWRSKGDWFLFEIPKRENDLGGEMSIGYGVKNIGRHGEKKSGCFMRTGFNVNGKEVPYPAFPECTFLEKGKWHHFAASLKEGKYLKIYIDGKKVAERKFPYSIARDIPSYSKIFIGWPRYIAKNMLVIDEVRISSIARNPDDTGFLKSPLVPDQYTLFLENFESVEKQNGKFYTKPFLINKDLPEKYLIKGGEIVKGKYGKGFSLSK